MNSISNSTKLIFIDQEPLTNRRKKAFEIDFLRQNRFDVEFWNLSEYCFGKVNIFGSFETEYTKKLDSIEKIEQNIAAQDISNTVFILEGHLAAIKSNLNNLLRKKGAITIRYELNTTSRLKSPGSVVAKFRNLTTKHKLLLPYVVAKKISDKICQKFDKPYSYICSTGSIFESDLKINHSDYILYLESRNQKPLLDYNYILFLDQFYPYHPDLKSNGLNLEKNAEPFFRDLNYFFDTLEKKYSKKVIIAAHPKAKYEPNVFGGREIYYGLSSQLTKDADAVITIDSASISFVMANSKPILLITTNDRQKCHALAENNKYQQRLAHTIGTTVLNISGARADDMILPLFSKEQRDNYVYTYLTSGGIEDKLNTELLPEMYKSVIKKR